MPYNETVSDTPRVDQCLQTGTGYQPVLNTAVDTPALDALVAKIAQEKDIPWLVDLVAVARQCERDCDMYRYGMHAALDKVWVPFTPSVDLTDDETDELMRSVGILGSKEKFQPHPEAWNTIRARHRRFAYQYLQALFKHQAVAGPAAALAALQALGAKDAPK